MAQKAGVICKTCGKGIEVDDQYILGIDGREMARNLYQRGGPRSMDFVNKAWHKRLTCGNPHCGKSHEYRGDDLLLYDN